MLTYYLATMSSTGDFVRVGNDAFSVDVLEMVDMFIPMDHWLVIKDGKVRDPKPSACCNRLFKI